MIYLIAHQIWFLLLALACAALAGWAWYGMRAQPKLDTAAAERDRLLRDLIAIGVEDGAQTIPPPEHQREIEALRMREEMANARVAELERITETARGGVDESASRIAELERALEAAHAAPPQPPSLEQQQAAALEVEARPVHDEEAEAQGWRLRYFEQRVRYLENQARQAPAPAADTGAQQMEWRARLAEARARSLEEQLRARGEVAPTEPQPAPEDDLVRWRRTYLEKRVEHLSAAPAPEPAPAAEEDNSAEIAKWRARYLEGRVRHLEARLVAAPTPDAVEIAPLSQAVEVVEPETGALEVVEAEPTPPPPLVPAGSEQRPQGLPAARDGAPDDLSMIEGVSLLQQTTLSALGIYHFEQIAAWTPANIAWVDKYLRLRGRIVEEDWVGQADALARDGVQARRLPESEDA